MNMAKDQPHPNTRTRSLRKNQTKSEGLLWSILRAKQLCGLRFRRQHHLQKLGWTIIRFTDDNVEQDAEAVGRAIAKELNVPYEFKQRSAMGSGSRSVKAAKTKKVKPSPR